MLTVTGRSEIVIVAYPCKLSHVMANKSQGEGTLLQDQSWKRYCQNSLYNQFIQRICRLYSALRRGSHPHSKFLSRTNPIMHIRPCIQHRQLLEKVEWKTLQKKERKKLKKRTYNSWGSLMVTQPTINRPACDLCLVKQSGGEPSLNIAQYRGISTL